MLDLLVKAQVIDNIPGEIISYEIVNGPVVKGITSKIAIFSKIS
jgi:hypothetical protein